LANRGVYRGLPPRNLTYRGFLRPDYTKFPDTIRSYDTMLLYDTTGISYL
jgi:hypothetical protein